MLTTCQECELISEKTSIAYFTHMLLSIETTQEGSLSLIIHSLCFICRRKLNRIVTLIVVDKHI